MAIHLIGGYQTDFARVWSREGLDYTDMMREAIDGALESCRLDVDDIDTIHVGNAFGELYRGQGHLAAMVAQVKPEFFGKPAMRHEAACASSSLGVLAASAEIEAGRYDCILVLGVEEEKNLPGDQIAADPKAIERLAAKTVVLYCGDGATTAAAQRTLAKAGAKDVFSLRGGLAAWTQENLPVVKG